MFENTAIALKVSFQECVDGGKTYSKLPICPPTQNLIIRNKVLFFTSMVVKGLCCYIVECQNFLICQWL